MPTMCIVSADYWLHENVQDYVEVFVKFNVQTLFETPSRLFCTVDFALFSADYDTIPLSSLRSSTPLLLSTLTSELVHYC